MFNVYWVHSIPASSKCLLLYIQPSQYLNDQKYKNCMLSLSLIVATLIRSHPSLMWSQIVAAATGMNAFTSHHLAVETPTVSLRKFTEQSGRKSHNKENKASVCDKWTLSFCYPTKLMNLFGYLLLAITKGHLCNVTAISWQIQRPY